MNVEPLSAPRPPRAGSNLRPQLVLELGQCPLHADRGLDHEASMRAGSTCAAWNIPEDLRIGLAVRIDGGTSASAATSHAARCNARVPTPPPRIKVPSMSHSSSRPRAGPTTRGQPNCSQEQGQGPGRLLDVSAKPCPLRLRLVRGCGFGESMLAERTGLRLRRPSSRRFF